MKRLFATLFVGLLALPAAVSAQSWQGAYGGGFVGYGAGDSRFTAGGTTTGDFDIDGALGGVYAGYNWQNGNTVFGLELELAAANIEGTTTLLCAACSTDLQSYVALKGRAGIEAGSGLLYGALGIAGAHVEVGAPVAPFSSSDNTFGWLAAVGYEAPLANSWSLRGELAYMDFDDVSAVFGGIPVSIDVKNIWAAKIGLTKHF